MLQNMSRNFFEQVYDIVRMVPQGRVTTYGAIANCLGSKKGARMVGWALHQALQQQAVPAHRVVNRAGLLTGKFHFQDVYTMQRKLIAEGVNVKDDRVQEFGRIFWDPMSDMREELIPHLPL